MKNLFTLIELIVVIAVLGILAAIIIPNISSFQEEANITAIESNVRNLQTSVDMYSLDFYGEVPTYKQPTKFQPNPINFDLITPEYNRDLPETEGVKYWVDGWGKVWASTIDAPENVDLTSTTLKWDTVPEADMYKVYKILDSNSTSSLFNPNLKLKFYKEASLDENVGLIVDDENVQYAVSAVDNNKFESAPAGSNYKGYDNYERIGDSNVNTGNGDLGEMIVTQTIDNSNTSASISSINQNVLTLSKKDIGYLGGDFKIGDEVMLYNSNTDNRINGGMYEFYNIKSISGSDITLDKIVSSKFSTSETQVVKIPHFTNFTVEEGLTLKPLVYSGTEGGVLAMRVSGTLTVKGSINANARGYAHNHKNPSLRGGNASGSSNDSRACDSSAGGGGSNQFAGGNGGKTNYGASSPGVGNTNPIGDNLAIQNQFFFGGAGGNSSWRSYCSHRFYGASGGGNIYIVANEIKFEGGTIHAKGGASRGAGQGAGGTIKLEANKITGIVDHSISAVGGGEFGASGKWKQSGVSSIAGGGGAGAHLYATGWAENGFNASTTKAGNGGRGYLGGGGGGGNGYIILNAGQKPDLSSVTLYPKPYTK